MLFHLLVILSREDRHHQIRQQLQSCGFSVTYTNSLISAFIKKETGICVSLM